MTDRQQRRIPELAVEQYRLGELSPERAAEVERALADEDGPTARRLAALQASDDEIRERYPASQVVPEIHRRALQAPTAGASPRRVWWIGSGVAALAAAAAVALLVVAGPWSVSRSSDVPGFLDGPETTRIKGLEPTLEVYRQEDGAAIRLRDEEAAHAGDLLQIAYVSGGHAYGVIYSVDGAGQITLHHPEAWRGSTALEREGRTPLAHAFELDDAPAYERFVFVAAGEPLRAEAVIDVLEPLDLARIDDLPAGELPEGWAVEVVTLRKEAE